MVYKRLPDNLPDILRKNGLKVVEVAGWKDRGRPASTGGYNPSGVLCHHTATNAKDWTDARVVKLLVEGRPDLPGPLVPFGLARDGTVYIIASGRCNHAGPAKASGPMPAGDGNELYAGIEAFNDGINEKWSNVQYNAYILLCAVLCKYVFKVNSTHVRGHKETSKTGKPDPKFDMNTFRRSVQNKIDELGKDKETTVTITASKPGPNLKHNGVLGKTEDHKIPLSNPVAVIKGKPYRVCTIELPSGLYVVTLQTRMPANLTAKGEMEFVRLGWPGLAAADSTGHNKVDTAQKIKGEWYRWRTNNHVINGGGVLAYDFVLTEDSDNMRFVAKAARIQ